MPPVTVIAADFDNLRHAAAIVDILDSYARDPMGGAHPLDDEVRDSLIEVLQATPSARVWLAQEGGAFVGVVTAFIGLSTFAAKPRWNVHDVAVLPQARGQGVGRVLLERVIADATAAGAVGVALEVRHDNAPARHLYASLGFGDGSAPMDFWVRPIA